MYTHIYVYILHALAHMRIIYTYMYTIVSYAYIHIHNILLYGLWKVKRGHTGQNNIIGLPKAVPILFFFYFPKSVHHDIYL